MLFPDPSSTCVPNFAICPHSHSRSLHTRDLTWWWHGDERHKPQSLMLYVPLIMVIICCSNLPLVGGSNQIKSKRQKWSILTMFFQVTVENWSERLAELERFLKVWFNHCIVTLMHQRFFPQKQASLIKRLLLSSLLSSPVPKPIEICWRPHTHSLSLRTSRMWTL